MTTHRVYRCFNAADQLIYIGCTSTTVELRMQRHRHGNPAVFEGTVRWTTEEHPDLASARRAEAYAIYDEAPLLNRCHNARRGYGYAQSLELNRPQDMEEMRLALEAAWNGFFARPRAG